MRITTELMAEIMGDLEVVGCLPDTFDNKNNQQTEPLTAREMLRIKEMSRTALMSASRLAVLDGSSTLITPAPMAGAKDRQLLLQVREPSHGHAEVSRPYFMGQTGEGKPYFAIGVQIYQQAARIKVVAPDIIGGTTSPITVARFDVRKALERDAIQVPMGVALALHTALSSRR